MRSGLAATTVGVPHPTWVETAEAVVVTPGAVATEEAVIAFCRRGLAGYQFPTSVEFVDERPRNFTREILKRDLRCGMGRLSDEPGRGGSGRLVG